MKTQSSVQEEISAEIAKRIKAKEETYAKRFDRPSTAIKKRWQRKIVQQVEAEKAQLSFDFMNLQE